MLDGVPPDGLGRVGVCLKEDEVSDCLVSIGLALSMEDGVTPDGLERVGVCLKENEVSDCLVCTGVVLTLEYGDPQDRLIHDRITWKGNGKSHSFHFSTSFAPNQREEYLQSTMPS